MKARVSVPSFHFWAMPVISPFLSLKYSKRLRCLAKHGARKRYGIAEEDAAREVIIGRACDYFFSGQGVVFARHYGKRPGGILQVHLLHIVIG